MRDNFTFRKYKNSGAFGAKPINASLVYKNSNGSLNRIIVG